MRSFRRLDKTLVDYLIIAISPALIMLLVGSFTFFLADAFYDGQYGGRIRYILALFVFAAVLIGRISIEQGTGYASAYIGALALATLAAFLRFVPDAFFMATLLLAVIWFATHRLTWNCTYIEEDDEDQGEGLLQTAHLDTPVNGQNATPPTRRPESFPDDDGLTTRSAASADSTADDAPTLDRWRQWFEKNDRRLHTPGIWIVYFSLGALPIFALGQGLLSRSGEADAERAFGYVFVYTAAGLGLLLTTSFLGLRRYLRRRGVQMNDAMAGTWLTAGAVLIAALLVVAMFLPRPQAVDPLSQWIAQAKSPDLDANRWAAGSDGSDQGNSATRNRSDEAQKVSDDSGGKESGGSGEKGEKGSSGDSKDENAQQVESGSSENQSQQGGPQQNGQQQDGNQQGQSNASGEEADREQPSESKQADSQQSQREGRDSKQRDNEDQSSDASQQSQSTNQSGDSNQGSRNPLESMANMLSTGSWLASILWIIKWLIAIAAVVFAIYWMLRHHRELLAVLRSWWAGLVSLLNSLFGGAKKPEARADEEASRDDGHLPRFVDFDDPFRSGKHTSMSPEDLLRHTLRATEAWAHDHGSPREAEQTPREFAEMLATTFPPMATHFRLLSGLHEQAAYAGGSLERDQVHRLHGLWRLLATN